MIHTKKVLLLSGGLDSTTALYEAVGEGVPIHALLVHYKSKHNDYELSCAKLHCRRLNVQYTTMELPELGGLTSESWIVQVRNSILLSLACNLATRIGAKEVIIGANKDDEMRFPDCRMAFFQAFNIMLIAAEINVEVVTPYLTWPKWKIAARAREIGVPLYEIWTCYTPSKNGKPCGTCPACLKLNEAISHK